MKIQVTHRNGIIDSIKQAELIHLNYESGVVTIEGYGELSNTKDVLEITITK